MTKFFSEFTLDEAKQALTEFLDEYDDEVRPQIAQELLMTIILYGTNDRNEALGLLEYCKVLFMQKYYEFVLKTDMRDRKN